MLLHWGSVPTYTPDEDDVDEVIDCNTSSTLFFLETLELPDA